MNIIVNMLLKFVNQLLMLKRKLKIIKCFTKSVGNTYTY